MHLGYFGLMGYRQRGKQYAACLNAWHEANPGIPAPSMTKRRDDTTAILADLKELLAIADGTWRVSGHCEHDGCPVTSPLHAGHRMWCPDHLADILGKDGVL